MLAKGAALLVLLVAGAVAAATTQTRLFGRLQPDNNNNNNNNNNRRSFEPARRDASFDPDVLNRFLEEYASKIKRPSERPPPAAYDDEPGLQLEVQHAVEMDSPRLSNGSETQALGDTPLNDTIKRHKFYNSNPQAEDRNSGWVTLDAVPWSKSKISKWQANPTTQVPFPVDARPWDKPAFGNKPWNSDFPSRPSYESNKPWQNKLTSKPHWSDDSPAASNKPWNQHERPRPDRPSYVDKYEENPNQAQKWPPERPSWDRYGDSSRPSSDIITDNGPPNFPSNNWDRPGQRPSYTHQTESYVSEAGDWHDRNDFGSKFGSQNRPEYAEYNDRPHFSQYQYPASTSHPANHPSSGDGQWVLLSTNRGYSKSRQRSIKFDAQLGPGDSASGSKKGHVDAAASGEKEEPVPAVTSKRQIRLTVLPSINGTNTTTSHGGLLEVERTFKTVEQSQKEFEKEEAAKSGGVRKSIVISKRPIRNGLAGGVAPSNSAVLAAVGAGMLPATMAMMIPMMLGRRKRHLLPGDRTLRLRLDQRPPYHKPI